MTEAIEAAETAEVGLAESTEVAEVPEGREVERAEEEGTVDRDEYETVDGSELQEASGEKEEDDGGEEATPINLPGPVAAQTEVSADAVKDESAPAEERGGVLPVPIPEPTEEEEGGLERGESQSRVGDDGSELMDDGSELMQERSGTGGQVAEVHDPGTEPPPPNREIGLKGGEAQVASGEGSRAAELGVNMEPIPSPEEEAGSREVAPRVEGEQVGEAPEPGPEPFPQPGGEGEEMGEIPEPGPDPFPQPAGEPGEVTEGSATLESTPDALAEEGSLEEEDLSEAEEHWEPPDVYVNADGEVVDADGKPVDSPPVVSSPDGKSYVASYPGMYDKDGDPVSFEVPAYKRSLKDLYLHDDGSGKLTVVDANGNPVDSPPIVFSDGQGNYGAHYPGDDPVSLKTYNAPIKDMYVHDDGSGNLTVVDANGDPVDSPPKVFSDGQGNYGAQYPGDNPVSLKMYKAPIKDMYVHIDSSGNPTVVNANGDPVDSPPKVFSDGQGNYGAQFPGDNPVSLKTYKAPIKDMYVHVDGSGNPTVVDANGDPVDSPPVVFSDGQGNYGAYYPGGTGNPTPLKYFKPPSGWKKKI
ncbi:MAG: hypothetical protein MAG431_01347 [Chloroflexi bacterium]|nr:hypothetical protein [Chloroflexota bacterium]